MKKRNMKVLALLMTVTMAGTMLAGCGDSGSTSTGSSGGATASSSGTADASSDATAASSNKISPKFIFCLIPAQQMLPAKIPQVQMMW